MLSMIISTLAFFVAAWYLNLYLDEQGIGKGMTRGVLVLVLASLVSWGVGAAVDWMQPQAASPNASDLSQLLKATGQSQP